MSVHTYWLFGISGTGKTTIAQALQCHWKMMGKSVVLLDEEELKKGILNDLPANAIVKDELTRRVAEVAKLFNQQGLDVIVACITPLEVQRQLAAELIGSKNVFFVFIEAPIQICQRRDPKGIYVKALSGRMKYFPGVNAPFEMPNEKVLKVSTDQCSVVQAVEIITNTLIANKN